MEQTSQDVPSPASLRDELQTLVLRDLLGPWEGPEETVEIADIRSRYLVGRLAPKGQLPLPEDQEDADMPDAGADLGEQTVEAPLRLTLSMLPSSIGMSFVVDGKATALQVTARWGRYTRVHAPVVEPPVETPPADAPAAKGKAAESEAPTDVLKHKPPPVRWQRHPVEVVSPPIPLRAGRMANWAPAPEQPDVLVEGLVRERGDQWHVTLFLVNGQDETEHNKGSVWLFQPELIVEAPDGAPIFEKRPNPIHQMDVELAGLDMRYRRRMEFTVGHGIAVCAELAPGSFDCAARLRTDVAPVYEAPLAQPPSAKDEPALAGLTLDMRALAAVPDGGFAPHLRPLVEAYGAWIDGLAARQAQPSKDLAPHKTQVGLAVDDCRTTLQRIEAGIALLDSSAQAAAAFRFANRAMADQRVHGIHAAQVRKGGAPALAAIEAEPANHAWRPFQLAFILLNLCGATEPTHPDRTDTADLLFFPTGGGKTEAYLGLAAFVMAMRRLQGVVSGRDGRAGIAVIMRYTLRLLTLQQFQRAAALLCACELIRREQPALWGDEPFRIGLWVGARTTPNNTDEAAKVITSVKTGGQPGGSGTPHQLTSCPWCGSSLLAGRDVEVETFDKGRCRTLVYCSDPLGTCAFTRKSSPGEGLPVITVDEEIYRRLPALLIATVDKFAQMPWNGRTGMLFGQVNGFCERHGYRSPDLEDTDSHPENKRHRLPKAKTLPCAPLRPPDLIIQDELHLISGPLGSLVGLYETVVDTLCTWEIDGQEVRPKVIASTATVRQARLQVHSLFARRLNVFPAPGLDSDDSFFAREKPVAQVPGRRFMGICAPGIRHRTALIRVYTTLLSAAWQIYEQHGALCDPWMTLVGYFNSLRELGAMRRSVDDSVSARLQRMKRVGLANRWLDALHSVEELTSRKDATQIPELLDRLEVGFDPTRKDAKPKPAQTRRPIDVLLATNMISVGVDVSRLGLMVVAGQPKNTAEYIQSSSRVGRSAAGPGLVLVVYNWTRPRDLSHYETFHHYHATAYQHVEALSVTPFSKGAVHRGLSGVFASAVRLMGADLNRNEGAGQFATMHAFTQRAIRAIRSRAAEVASEAEANDVEAQLKHRADQWAHRVSNTAGAALVYKKKSGTQAGLLHSPEEETWSTFTCLNSLREVEPTAKLILNTRGFGDGQSRPWTMQPAPSEGSDHE